MESVYQGWENTINYFNKMNSEKKNETNNWQKARKWIFQIKRMKHSIIEFSLSIVWLKEFFIVQSQCTLLKHILYFLLFYSTCWEKNLSWHMNFHNTISHAIKILCQYIWIYCFVSHVHIERNNKELSNSKRVFFWSAYFT